MERDQYRKERDQLLYIVYQIPAARALADLGPPDPISARNASSLGETVGGFDCRTGPLPMANLPFGMDYCSKERPAKRQRTDEESGGNSSSNPPKRLQAGHPGFKSKKCAPYLAKSDYVVDACGKQQRAGQDIGLITVSDGATNPVIHLPPIWEVVEGSQKLQVQKILIWPA